MGVRVSPAGFALVALTGLVVVLASMGCSGGESAAGEAEEAENAAEALGAARHHVIADVDEGRGVIVANRPGGFYMGRLLPGQSFDRQGAWYTSKENGTSYAWGMAWGHSDACLWIGPSRGKKGFTAGTWASPGAPGSGARCTDAQKEWLVAGDAKNLGSHFNCPPPTASAHGTEKVLTKDAPLSWNVVWGKDYRGGAAHDFARTLPAGTHVWYRYTTPDGKHLVVFVPGTGWGFVPAGVLDRSHTGTWSFPSDPGTPHAC